MKPATSGLLGVAAGIAVGWFVFTPNAGEAHRIDDYSRVRSIAERHEACLRELAAEGSSASSLREANGRLAQMRERADNCFRGLWAAR